MARFLFTMLPANDFGLPTRPANGKCTNEKFLETDVWLKRDGKWQVARVHYSDAPTPAMRKP
jgi:Calcium/calmodulin dependent protein kinase II association domain